MRATLRAMAVGAALFGSAASVGAQEAKAPVDVSGTWLYTVVTDNGTGEPVVTFVQEGTTLTGSYSSRMMGDRNITGYVKGDSVVFVLEATNPSAPELTYKGVLIGKDDIKGVVDFGGMGGATFTAKRED